MLLAGLVVPSIGTLDTGWTFYFPYAGTTQTHVVLAVTGVFILGFSSIFTGINFIVTMHTLRPPGMGWFRMPLFLWGLYATALIQVLATPVLAVTLLLIAAERILGVGIFDPNLGGDPVLFQHFFWFYSHPAVYIMILPAMGIISEVISVFSGKHIFGYRFIAYSSVAIALIGFLVWGHHMFVSTQSPLAAMIFSALTFAVAIPSAIKVFNWLATMYKGSIWLATPMCYALVFLFLFAIGGLTGLFLGTLSVNVIVHGTYFVVAHFHYVMVGGTMVGLLAGLHYWWPKITGRMYSEFWGRIGPCWCSPASTSPSFPSSSSARGACRGALPATNICWPSNPEFHRYNVYSSLGAYLLAAALVLIAVYLAHSLFAGRRARPIPGARPRWNGSAARRRRTTISPRRRPPATPTISTAWSMTRPTADTEERDHRKV